MFNLLAKIFKILDIIAILGFLYSGYQTIHYVGKNNFHFWLFGFSLYLIIRAFIHLVLPESNNDWSSSRGDDFLYNYYDDDDDWGRED